MLQLGLDLSKVDLEGLLASLPHSGAAPPRPRPRSRRPQDSDASFAPAAPLGRPVPSGKHSRAHGQALAGGCCGERMRFTVTVCNHLGEVCHNSDALVTVLVEGLSLMSKTHPEPRPWVENNRDGTYSVQFVCSTPGRYHITASVEGVALPMCPVEIDVLPGVASAHQSEIHGLQNQIVDAGGMGKFTVVACDEFGNRCYEGGSRLGARAVGHAKLHEVMDNDDGTYGVLYSVPEWAHGPVKIEVLLDGVPLRDSPVVPQVRQRSLKEEANEQTLARPGGTAIQDQLERLRWLQQNPPVEVPDLPPVSLLEGAAASIPRALGDASRGDGPAAAAAWRAADEWRQLSEARAEIARAREDLRRHQEVLLSVGNAVHGEYMKVQDQDRGMAVRKAELEQVEDQLHSLRAELGRQYMHQQRQALAAPSCGSTPAALGAEHSTARHLANAQRGGSSSLRHLLSPTSASPRSRDWEALSPVGGQQESSLSAEMAQLAALREGFERKRQYLQQLEETDRVQSRQGALGARRVDQYAGALAEVPPPAALPPAIPPFDASPPSDFAGSSRTPRARGQRNLLTEPLPPPEAPPAVSSPALSRVSPRVRALPAPDLEDWASSPGGIPSSPPMSPDSPLDWGASSPSRSDADIGHVMKHIFHAYASKSGGSVALPPKGGRSARVALCKQDLVRLAQAAHLRLPGSELENVFDNTAQRFGALKLGKASGADLALPFELFVELITETAKRQYSDLPEGDATRLLFEKNLAPLSRRLAELEGSD